MRKQIIAIFMATAMPVTSMAEMVHSDTYAASPSLSNKDLLRLHQTYTDNEAKFNAVYIGRRLEVTLPFASASAAWFSGGKTMRVSAGANGYSADVSCEISGADNIAFIATLDKDDPLTIQGTIKDSVMQTIMLKDCSITKGEINEGQSTHHDDSYVRDSVSALTPSQWGLGSIGRSPMARRGPGFTGRAARTR